MVLIQSPPQSILGLCISFMTVFPIFFFLNLHSLIQESLTGQVGPNRLDCHCAHDLLCECYHCCLVTPARTLRLESTMVKQIAEIQLCAPSLFH